MTHQRSFARSGGAAVASVAAASWLGEQGSRKAVHEASARTFCAATRLLRRTQQCQTFSPPARAFGAPYRPPIAARPSGVSVRTASSNATPKPAAASPSSTSKASNAKITTDATAAAAAAAEKQTFVQWYEGHLNSRPVVTKMVTGSFLWGLGDCVAQVMPAAAADAKPIEYDAGRTARAVFYGFAIHAPVAHAHYNFLEWMTVRAGFKGLSVPVFKTVMEQFVYWSWISNGMYHSFMGAVQGMTPGQVMDRLRDVLWDTQKAQWAFWIPVQLVNFNFVPVRHQLNVVLVVSVAWAAMLSAWYPPEEEEEKKEKLPVGGTETM